MPFCCSSRIVSHDHRECRPASDRPGCDCSTLQPSMPGIMMSSVMTDGPARAPSAMPSSPSCAVTTSNPSRLRTAPHQVAHRRVVVDHQHAVGCGAGAPRRARVRVMRGRARGRRARRCASGRQRTVKVVPAPGVLATVTAPPIMRQSRSVMARPRPVPPYLRVVELSAWVNSWNSRPSCSSGHADAGVARPRTAIRSRRRRRRGGRQRNRALAR